MPRHALVVGAIAAACVGAGCASRSVQPTTVIVDAGATVPPQIVRQAAIEVPPELLGRSCTSGTAAVEVKVDTAGRAQGTRVSRASSEPAFDEACARSARRTSYRPGTSHGRPTVGTTTIECRLDCP
jgi:TonB family protein